MVQIFKMPASSKNPLKRQSSKFKTLRLKALQEKSMSLNPLLRIFFKHAK